MSAAIDSHIQPALALAALGSEVERLEWERIALDKRAHDMEARLRDAEHRIAALEDQLIAALSATAQQHVAVARQGEVITALLTLIEQARERAAKRPSAPHTPADETVSLPVPAQLRGGS